MMAIISNSPPLHHTVPANLLGFRAGRVRNSGRLVRRVAVCEPNSGRSPGSAVSYRLPVLPTKFRFPDHEMENTQKAIRLRGIPTGPPWRGFGERTQSPPSSDHR